MQLINNEEIALANSVIDYLNTFQITRDHTIAFRDLLTEQPDTIRVSIVDDVFNELKRAQDTFNKFSITKSEEFNRFAQLINKRLSTAFRPFFLYSVKQFKQQLKQHNLVMQSGVQDKIISALRNVHKTDFPHERLDKLLDLKNLLHNIPVNSVVNKIRAATNELIQITLNAQTEDEVVNKLKIRNQLRKYKPDFITMPPP